MPISTVNCTEITGDKPRQSAYKIFSIKRRLSVQVPTPFVQGILSAGRHIWVVLQSALSYVIACCILIFHVAAPMPSRVTWAFLKLLICRQLSVQNCTCLIQRQRLVHAVKIWWYRGTKMYDTLNSYWYQSTGISPNSCRRLCDFHRNFPTGKVADTNHENPRHQSCCRLSWFVSTDFVADFPHAL